MLWLSGVIGGIFLAAAVIVILMVIGAFRKRIITEEIILASLPDAFDGYRILFITDIHRRRLPAKLLTPLKGQVDVVLLGGDLTERNGPIKRLVDNMALVTSMAPTYVVHGNHDYRANISLVDKVICASGAKLLLDENVALEREGATLWLTGVNFPPKGGNAAYRPLPRIPTSSTSADSCRIILVHDPLWLSNYKRVPADLVLAGHTHGGQVVLPFAGHRHRETFYHKYDAGLFEWPKADDSMNHAQLLISRGYGTAHLPLRWGSPAEMHILTLRTPNRSH